MNKNNQSIEDLFKSEFENFQITPEENAWAKIEKKLAFKNFLKFNYSQFNIYYLALSLLLTGFMTTIDFSANEKNLNTTAQLISSIKIQKTETSKATSNNNNSKKKKQTTYSENNYNSAKTTLRTDSAETKDKKNQKADPCTSEKRILTNSHSDKEEPFNTAILNSDTVLLNQKQAAPQKAVSLNLSLSQTQGCAPLEVQYKLTSKNAKDIKLSLGSKDSVICLNSKVTYKLPGTYIISATAKDSEGKITSRKETIHVFPNPKAVVIIDVDASCTENCIAYFYNYSTGSVKYSWDFGDQNNSNIKDPVHIYTNTQLKTIKLKVWSEKMCQDSITIKTPFKKSNANKLEFPTAFMPNAIGSSNGYYNLSNYSSDIFYPINSGVKDYNLEIYSRTGTLLFQTQDINQGWDGYYKYKLMPQNVYLWKVSGTFNNGELFEMAGDVTLLRK